MTTLARVRCHVAENRRQIRRSVDIPTSDNDGSLSVAAVARDSAWLVTRRRHTVTGLFAAVRRLRRGWECVHSGGTAVTEYDDRLRGDQEQAAGRVGDRGLSAGGQHVADHRRAAGRGGRCPGRAARSGRCLRSGQCGAGRGAPVRRGDRGRLRGQSAGAGPRTGGRRASAGDVRRGRRREAAGAGRVVRPGAQHGRRDVRAEPPAGRGRAGPGDQARVAGSRWPAGRRAAWSGRCSRPCRSGRRRRPGCSRPTLWGTEEHLSELFGDRVEWTALAASASTSSAITRRSTSPSGSSEFYGPITRLAGTLGGSDKRAVRGRPGRRTASIRLRERRHGRRSGGVPGRSVATRR